MAHINETAQLTTPALIHGVEALLAFLDPLATVAEIQSRTRHCTRAELLVMLDELGARVRARGETWQRAHAGRAA